MNGHFLCPLDGRGIIEISGKDRGAFLQGLISNDISLCRLGQPIYAALLTPQGKFLHDLFVIDNGESFLMDCERDRAEDLIKRLSLYKLRSDIKIESRLDIYVVWASREQQQDTGMIYADPRHADLGFRLILNKSDAARLQATAFSAYDQYRLRLGIADGSRDMLVGKSTLLEGNFDRNNGISWTKGCYMGQELTARMHYRALVKKRLYPVRLNYPALIHESLIYIDGQESGELRSSCGEVGLALLNVEKSECRYIVLNVENFVKPV
jgi:folate-binding protein YgfZ